MKQHEDSQRAGGFSSIKSWQGDINRQSKDLGNLGDLGVPKAAAGAVGSTEVSRLAVTYLDNTSTKLEGQNLVMGAFAFVCCRLGITMMNV